MGYLVPSLIWFVYLSAGLFSARSFYARIRPYTEPVACDSAGQPYHTHYSGCYERYMGVDGPGVATVLALLGGAGWPLTWTVMAVGPRLQRWFARAATATPEEVAAKIDRMERDLNL